MRGHKRGLIFVSLLFEVLVEVADGFVMFLGHARNRTDEIFL